MNSLFDEIKSIYFLDIGCSGQLDEKWRNLSHLFCYVGFDPNLKECERLSHQVNPYKTVLYLPYALAGEKATKMLFKTQSIYCYSLLRPNHNWLNRFSYYDLFKEVGTESVICTTLNALVEEQDLKADIIKIDSQGLDLEILKAGDRLLENVFCIETEPGFLENYIGENTFAEVDQYLRAKGFLMFDIFIARVARKNENPLTKEGIHQPIWCQALYLFDFIGTDKKATREQALKALMICNAIKCYDYAWELAAYFNKHGVIESDIFNDLIRQGKLNKKKPIYRKGATY